LVNHSEGEYVNKEENHINGLEYLKRQLSSRDRIRKEKMNLYLSSIFGDIVIKNYQQKK